MKEQYVFIGDIRGKGLMWGMEFVANRSSREPYPPTLNLTSKIVQECFANGLIVYPSQKFLWGTTGDSIMIAPPLIISKQEMDELLDRLSQVSRESIIHYKKYIQGALGIESPEYTFYRFQMVIFFNIW